MAKTREQVIQEQLGAMAFQIAILSADNEALREELESLKLESLKAKPKADIDAPAARVRPVASSPFAAGES